MKMNITIDEIEVSIKLTRNPKMVLAQATLTFGDLIEIHGFTVSKSQQIHSKFQEKIWIQPPKIKYGSFWVKLVFIKNQDLWSEIEEKIYNEFRLKFVGEISNEEEVNIDEIPI